MVIIPITKPVHRPVHIDAFYLGFNYHRLKSALQPAPGEAATRTCRQTQSAVSSEQIRRRPIDASDRQGVQRVRDNDCFSVRAARRTGAQLQHEEWTRNGKTGVTTIR